MTKKNKFGLIFPMILMSLPADQFTTENNYFALSAVDASGNESAKTTGIYTIIKNQIKGVVE